MSGQETDALKPGELTIDQFGFWRNHPVTKVVLKYLEHRNITIQDQVMIGWKSGAMKLVDEQVYRGQFLAFDHINNLSWADLMEFYNLPTGPVSDAEEANQPTISTEQKEDDGIEIDE